MNLINQYYIKLLLLLYSFTIHYLIIILYFLLKPLYRKFDSTDIIWDKL